MTEKTVNGQKTTYTYNLDNRLSEIKDNSNQVIAQYEYDPFGRRTKKYLQQTNETIYFHYSDEGLIAEYTDIAGLIQSYGFKPDSLFTSSPVFTHRPDFSDAKGYAYYINDHLGTPQKLITNTGRKVWEASTDAFGKTIISNNEFINPLRFPGQYTDTESELKYNWFRYYDAQLGRYLRSDPLDVLYSGINSYEYVYGNPLAYYDPSGLLVCGGACVGGVVMIIGRAILQIGIRQGVKQGVKKTVKTKVKNAAKAAAAAKAASKAKEDCDIDCEKERESADRRCRQLIWQKQTGKRKANINGVIRGGDLEKCIKGMLPEKCGGDPIKKPKKKKTKKYKFP